jgi:integrase/recombinase XerD
MNDKNLLGPWIRRFLLEYLVGERNLARNTQASYRDTLTLLLPFVSKRAGVVIDKMAVDDISPAIVRQFLDHLERDRQCTGVARNQRLGAIHSLARFIGMRSPVHLSWCTEVRLIPFKKTDKTLISYLEKAEMDELLRQPDRDTVLGLRDYVLLLFLYNSGARADEAARLTIGHLHLDNLPSVRILGKGNKIRICPLWPMMIPLLRKLTAGRSADQVVFLGRANKPMTRFGSTASSRATPRWQARKFHPCGTRGSVRTTSDIPLPFICCAAAPTSIRSERGWDMSRWTRRIYTPRSTWK